MFVRPKGLGTRTQFGLHACQDRRTLRLATQPEDPNILKSPTAIGCSGHVGQRRMGMYIRPPLWRHPLAVFNLIQLPWLLVDSELWPLLCPSDLQPAEPPVIIFQLPENQLRLCHLTHVRSRAVTNVLVRILRR